MEIDPDKLEALFKERYESLEANITGFEDRWINYCDQHKIIMLHPEWLLDTLNDKGKMRDKVCIHNCEEIYHENVCPWLLVPKKFALKCLVLGGLP